MSSLVFDVYARPKNDESKRQLRNLINLAGKSKTKSILKLLPPQWDGSVEYLSDELCVFQRPRETADKKLLKFAFESGTLFDFESFCELLKMLGANEFEIEVKNTQVGEIFFLDEAGEYGAYHYKRKWRWLPRPTCSFDEEALQNEFVVVTGTFSGLSRSKIEAMIHDVGGVAH